jgi:hypothetical protein
LLGLANWPVRTLPLQNLTFLGGIVLPYAHCPASKESAGLFAYALLGTWAMCLVTRVRAEASSRQGEINEEWTPLNRDRG